MSAPVKARKGLCAQSRPRVFQVAYDDSAANGCLFAVRRLVLSLQSMLRGEEEKSSLLNSTRAMIRLGSARARQVASVYGGGSANNSS